MSNEGPLLPPQLDDRLFESLVSSRSSADGKPHLGLGPVHRAADRRFPSRHASPRRTCRTTPAWLSAVELPRSADALKRIPLTSAVFTTPRPTGVQRRCIARHDCMLSLCFAVERLRPQARHLLLCMQSRMRFATGDSRQRSGDGNREGEEGQATKRQGCAAGSFESGVRGLKGWSDRATFPDLADATQQLEEIVDSETKSPATCGAFFCLRSVGRASAATHFCFQAPLSSW